MSCPTLQLHELPPCPSLSYRVCSNSSIESVMPSNHLILCHSQIMLFMYKAHGAHKQIHSISGVLKFNEKYDWGKISTMASGDRKIMK